jgi:hypothetical protein
MNAIRTAALVAALVTMSASSFGQEKKDAAPATAPPATEAPPVATPPATTAPPAASPSPAAPPAEASKPPPPTEQRGVMKDDEFIPTQDIPPDEGVTFPVGI